MKAFTVCNSAIVAGIGLDRETIGNRYFFADVEAFESRGMENFESLPDNGFTAESLDLVLFTRFAWGHNKPSAHHAVRFVAIPEKEVTQDIIVAWIVMGKPGREVYGFGHHKNTCILDTYDTSEQSSDSFSLACGVGIDRDIDQCLVLAVLKNGETLSASIEGSALFFYDELILANENGRPVITIQEDRCALPQKKDQAAQPDSQLT